jgi:hypothetical protein
MKFSKLVNWPRKVSRTVPMGPLRWRKPGQQVTKVLNAVEHSLIEYALAEGHEILNIQGTKRREHQITSSGSRESRSWFPKQMFVAKRRG